jgi:hypothetical protein
MESIMSTTKFVNMKNAEYEIAKTDEEIIQFMSNRYKMWEEFAREVGDHVESYTVPQYGDYPNDQITNWTTSDFKTTIIRYANRMGNNARGDKEALRDMLKIAHYASMAWHKLGGTEREIEKVN